MADQNTTSLSIAVDSTGVRTAEGDLKNFAKAGKDAASTATLLERAMEANVSPANQAASAFSKVAPAGTILKGAAQGADQLTASTKLSAYQTQQLSFQLQDLGVQLAGGASPLLALAQQGSQVASSLGGVRSAAAIVGGAIGTTAAVVGSFAAAVAAVVAIYELGSGQSRAFANAISQSGNAAGLTEAKFNTLIDRTADLTNSSKAAAREMALGFVQSGQLSGQALESTVTTALNMAKATGRSVEDVQKQLLSVTNGVANFAATQNRSLNFLTSAQYRYIKSLEDQGNTAKAITVTMDALNDRYNKQAQNLGLIEKAYEGAKKKVSDFWESLKSIGREKTVDELITNAEERLKALDERRSNNPQLTEQRRAAIEALLVDLRKVKEVSEEAAKGQADDAARAKIGIEYTDVLARAYGRQQVAAKALKDAKDKLAQSDLSAADQVRVIAQMQKELDPGAQQALGQSQIQGIKRSLDNVVTAYESAESVLEGSRQAGLVSDRDYYAQKIEYVRLYEQARVRALQLENDALQRQRRNPDNMTADDTALRDRIADNQAEIGRIQQKAAADTVNYQTQAGAALGNLAKSYSEARSAAEAYIETLNRQMDREAALYGAGADARARESARNQISDRYDEERRRIEQAREALRTQQGERGLRPDQEEQFTKLLDLNEEYRQKALQGWDESYDRLEARQRDWSAGVSEAFANYANEASKAGKQAEQVFTNAAKNMEDALVTFATTGKINFASLAQSIIADILRVEAQRLTSSIFSNVLGFASTFFGGMTVSPGNSTAGITGDTILPNTLRGGRAIGGPVSAGGIYRINEQDRPEVATFGGKDYLLTGGQSGTVKPAGESSGGHTFQFNIGQGVTRNEVAALIPTIVKQVEAVVSQKGRRTARLGG